MGEPPPSLIRLSNQDGSYQGRSTGSHALGLGDPLAKSKEILRPRENNFTKLVEVPWPADFDMELRHLYWMSYSITIEWSRDNLYDYLDGLRDIFGSFASQTPAHISMLSFLRVPDEELSWLKDSMRRVSRDHYAQTLLFNGMEPDEPFGETCVAVPMKASLELEEIWVSKLVSTNVDFRPHVAITVGKGNIRDIHERVMVSLKDWASSHGEMKAKATKMNLVKIGVPYLSECGVDVLSVRFGRFTVSFKLEEEAENGGTVASIKIEPTVNPYESEVAVVVDAFPLVRSEI
ncbi:hypothetical protein DFH07DRAFT_780432 [Mycena maculata]|uniref:Uncharacterized protein n=1 Tax=Mycena maculata TaxID=230809 RepID=A0AAD7I4K9_9AGAR|nr:hypothetical protein DFH07DRAFT_780432 [Mycena maculata]